MPPTDFLGSGWPRDPMEKSLNADFVIDIETDIVTEVVGMKPTLRIKSARVVLLVGDCER